jgi:DNA-binding CsgD family transcriptional regulator
MNSAVTASAWSELLGVVLDWEQRPVVVIHPDGRAAAANAAMATTLERSQNEFSGLPLEALFAPDSRSGVRKLVEACIADRVDIFDTICETKNGSAVPVTMRLVNSSMHTHEAVAHVFTIVAFRPKTEAPVLANGIACTVSADAKSFGVITRAWGPGFANRPSPVGRRCCEAFCEQDVPCRACTLYAEELTTDTRTTVVTRRSAGNTWFDIVSVRAIGHAEIAMSRWRLGKEVLGALTTARIDELAADAKLSPREAEVLGLLFLGRSTNDIAHQMNIVARTAKYHQRNVLRKVGAESRFDLSRLLL